MASVTSKYVRLKKGDTFWKGKNQVEIEANSNNDTQVQIRCDLREIQGTYMIKGDGSRFDSTTVGQLKYSDVRSTKVAKQIN